MRPRLPWLALLLTLLLPACGDGGGGGGGVLPDCGNGALETGEACDDGDVLPCDGCSATCEDEVGFVCGDDLLNEECGETCDDGNTDPGDGCDANCQVEDGEPLDLDGSYAIEIDTVADGCRFGSRSASTPMEVKEMSPTVVRVDVPIGGAGGTCDPKLYTRRGNTLERTEVSIQVIGSCTVEVELSITLDFAEDGGVTGTQIDSLSEVSGSCSAIPLPCTVELAIDGDRCRGCFSCVSPLGAPRQGGLGAFGSALRPARSSATAR